MMHVALLHCVVKCLSKSYSNLEVYRRIASEFSPPSGTFPEATTTVPLISREELDRHNEEEHGSWLLVDGRVYDAHTLAERCPYGIERLAEWVERDGAGHSQATQELVDQCCVGTFGEVSVVWGHSILR